MAGAPPGHPPPPQGYGPPPMPPPPPPPDGSWSPPKPTSGKAIAALICGLVGFIVFCYLPAVAALVGVVLGILALLETGKEGTRSGRGLAIAGLIISVLSVTANIGWYGFLFVVMSDAEQQVQTFNREALSKDSALIVARIVEYANANEGSLGPGGPVLARSGGTQVNHGGQPTNVPGTPVGGNVAGSLRLEHLVGENELTFMGGRDGWELQITGQSTAVIRARDWSGEIVWEVEIRDAAAGRTVQTRP